MAALCGSGECAVDGLRAPNLGLTELECATHFLLQSLLLHGSALPAKLLSSITADYLRIPMESAESGEFADDGDVARRAFISDATRRATTQSRADAALTAVAALSSSSSSSEVLSLSMSHSPVPPVRISRSAAAVVPMPTSAVPLLPLPFDVPSRCSGRSKRKIRDGDGDGNNEAKMSDDDGSGNDEDDTYPFRPEVVRRRALARFVCHLGQCVSSS